MIPHRMYVFSSDPRDPSAAQIAVELWPDNICVKVRPAASAIWGLPLSLVSVEGDPIHFAFEEEGEESDEFRGVAHDWDSS